jgi:phage FluMu protein gp41
VDARIENLKSTTFAGMRLTRRQIASIQETVKTFSALSRRELAHTICEHLNWQTPKGEKKFNHALAHRKN